jgi:hypothetical protein
MFPVTHPDIMMQLANERAAHLHAEADADRMAHAARAKPRPAPRRASVLGRIVSFPRVASAKGDRAA